MPGIRYLISGFVSVIKLFLMNDSVSLHKHRLTLEYVIHCSCVM